VGGKFSPNPIRTNDSNRVGSTSVTRTRHVPLLNSQAWFNWTWPSPDVYQTGFEFDQDHWAGAKKLTESDPS